MTKTVVVKILDPNTDVDKIQAAAQLIRDGELVGFPTETVYGLGANALDDNAVEKIFIAKGRPADNPLIVHIDNIDQWSALVEKIPDQALEVAEAFWPGPLTIVLKKKVEISDKVTAGLDTVAVRMPSHPVARRLIAAAGLPLAAPSANLSGRPSPTKSSHIIEDMNGRIPMILDGGNTDLGVESTVLDMTGELPVILRPGGVTREMLEAVIGNVLVDQSIFSSLKKGQRASSPGMKYKHYAPKAPVTIYNGEVDKLRAAIVRETKKLVDSGMKVGILTTDENMPYYTSGIVKSMGSRSKPDELATALFSLLRGFDDIGVDIILAEGVDIHDEGMAVMNRLARAAGFHIIEV